MGRSRARRHEMSIEVEPVFPGSDRFERVLALYRAHKATLGFLTRGAFREFADRGCLLAAWRHGSDGEVAGYLGYRLTGRSAVLVHLCVGRGHRGQGVATRLLKALFDETSELDTVRLSCREDYAEANRLWPRLGFVCVSDRPGRGSDGVRLRSWQRRVTGPPPLLQLMERDSQDDRQLVALDANAFYDLDSDDERGEESRALQADWLTTEIRLCTTAELFNEIARHPDPGLQRRNREKACQFRRLEASPSVLEQTVQALAELLPKARTDSDESDRRQLAHAVAEGAAFFVTRDSALLDHAHLLLQRFKMNVVRPGELITTLYAAREPDEYMPARLAGTEIQQRSPLTEGDLAPFLRYSTGETSATWLALCRGALSHPERYSARLIQLPDAEARLLYVLDRSMADRLRIAAFRVLSHPLAPTLVRRVLADLLLEAGCDGRQVVECADSGDPIVRAALGELEFVPSGSSFAKASVATVANGRDEALALVQQALQTTLPEPDAYAAETLERMAWPLKIAGAGLRSFVVPIQPGWARDLFDAGLAERDLFGARVAPALALENVYYSASRVDITAGARILWYVSAPVSEIRACSICLGTVVGTAKDLFRRFWRLGVFRWDNLTAKVRQPVDPLRAYRFSFTELFSRPTPWADLQQILLHHTGHENPLASPVSVAESVFLELYGRGRNQHVG